ncbi:LysR substrate-binding domain-containing protein [Rhizobium mongolense]|uniref:LysR substrate-binding domain-containing protein n=1 Tax=Rhizobium mongolense TaxID=57676 RepID=UPI0034A1C15F
MWAAASPAYLAEHGAPIHPSDRRDHTCLAFTVWGPNHAWRFSRGGETIAAPLNGPLTINNGQALLQAALAGLGVVVQAYVLLGKAIASGELIRLLPDWDLPRRPIQLVVSRRAPPSAKLHSFVSFMSKRLA